MLVGLSQFLEEEFGGLLAHKDPTEITMEPRIRNMRYIGELCKFRLMHFGTVFTFLKQLLDDFVHHNIDAACALIETAGSFLIRLPETQIRMENMLEVGTHSPTRVLVKLFLFPSNFWFYTTCIQNSKVLCDGRVV